MHILSEAHETILKDERKLLGDLRVSLVQIGATSDDQDTLAQSISQLEEVFLLVVVGEFNSGKSSFINALLGSKYLKEGVTPTTTQINLLHPGETQERQVINKDLHVLILPAPILQEISIVDTPGTNAVIREHEQITSEFIPRSDLVIFITSSERPFTESERAFLTKIRDWGKKVIIVINKTDILETAEEEDQIVQFVRENAFSLLGIYPEIFPISARLALRAKLGEPGYWIRSKFEPLEKYIQETLDQKSRIQLKLLNPLGVSKHLVHRYLDITKNRLDLLSDDFAMIEDVNTQLNMYQSDMMRDFRYRIADLENILYEIELRGDEYFDEVFRIARFLDLISKKRIQQEFSSRVVADVPQRIEKKVNELIDWLVKANLYQWQAVHEHLGERRKQYQSRIIGDDTIGTFQYDREQLMDAVGKESLRVINSYDKDIEAQAIADSAQEAVAASAVLEVGAIGLGALVTTLATTAVADATGILLASVVAAIGLFVIPTRRRQVKKELREKTTELRAKLTRTLRTHFEKEIERGVEEIQNAIAPYTRFVRAERAKLDETKDQLTAIQNSMLSLENRINSL